MSVPFSVHDQWATPVLVVDLHKEFHFKLAQLALDMEMNSPSVQKSNKVGSCAAVHHVIPGTDSTNKLTHRHIDASIYQVMKYFRSTNNVISNDMLLLDSHNCQHSQCPLMLYL